VNRALVAVFEDANEIALAGFLKCKDGLALETNVWVASDGDVTHKSLEWQLGNHQVRRLLEPLDLFQGKLAGFESLGGLLGGVTKLDVLAQADFPCYKSVGRLKRERS